MPKGTETMDIGTAILDLLKALIWPVLILTVVLMFRKPLDRILRHLADRTSALENVKIGSVAISFTAKVVANSVHSDPGISQGERQAIEQNWQALNNPLADVIALRLWRGKSHVEQMVRDILEPTRLNEEKFLPGFMYAWTLSARKILDALQELRYVESVDDEYELTDAGRAIFKEVVENKDTILARFRDKRINDI